MIFHKSFPVGGNITRVPYRNEKIIRRVTQDIDNFKGGGFLSFDAVRIDGIYQSHRIGFSQFPDNLQSLVEITVDGYDFRAVDHCLRQFAQSDLPFRYHDDGFQTAVGGVSRR